MSNESLVTIPTHEFWLLFDSKLLCNMTLLWFFMSCNCPDVKLNPLLQSKQKNPVCSLVQNYFLVWLCGWFMSWTFKSRCQIKPLVTIPTHESCSLFDSKLLCSMTLWWYFKSCTFKSRCQIEPLVTIPTHESCSLFYSKLLFSMTLWCWFMSWTFKSRCQIEPLVTIPTHESCLLFDSKLLCSMTLWWYFKSCTFKPRC